VLQRASRSSADPRGPLRAAAHEVLQFDEVHRAEGRHLVALQMAPHVLDGVRFWCVSRQVLELDRAKLTFNAAHQAGTMRGEPVPDDKQIATDAYLVSQHPR